MSTIINNKKNITKEDLVKNIFLKIGISSSYSLKIVNDIIQIIISNSSLTKKIKIKNFGTFSLRKKKKE